MPLEEEQEKKRLLARVDLLESLSAEEMCWLVSRTPEVRLGRGQMLYGPRHVGTTIYLLLEGRMHLYRMVGGQLQTLDVLDVGAMFGEAALTGKPGGSYAQALEPARIALLSLRTLGRLAQRNPEVGLKMASVLAERLGLYGSRMADIALKGVLARLASLLLHLCDNEGVMTSEGYYRIPTRYTHEQLAYMIGARRVAVTRAFGTLRKRGAVTGRRHLIYIKDLEALKGIAKEG